MLVAHSVVFLFVVFCSVVVVFTKDVVYKIVGEDTNNGKEKNTTTGNTLINLLRHWCPHQG